MANNTREFYKKQLGEMTNSQLLEVMHGTPVGLMSTNVGNDRMKIALELIQERWDTLEERIRQVEITLLGVQSKALVVPKLSKKQTEEIVKSWKAVPGKLSTMTVSTVEKKRGRGRPPIKKVSVA